MRHTQADDRGAAAGGGLFEDEDTRERDVENRDRSWSVWGAQLDLHVGTAGDIDRDVGPADVDGFNDALWRGIDQQENRQRRRYTELERISVHDQRCGDRSADAGWRDNEDALVDCCDDDTVADVQFDLPEADNDKSLAGRQGLLFKDEGTAQYLTSNGQRSTVLEDFGLWIVADTGDFDTDKAACPASLDLQRQRYTVDFEGGVDCSCTGVDRQADSTGKLDIRDGEADVSTEATSETSGVDQEHTLTA